MRENKASGSNVKVVCRFRPLIDIELNLASDNKSVFTFPTDESVISTDGDSFTYDRVFSTAATQSEIFDFVGRPIIEDVLTGYNGTVLAYGQTGSGKSYSMMGLDIYDDTSKGLIPRAIKLIFESVEKEGIEAEFTLKCSMLEIYKETLKDLCGYSGELKIKESKQRGIYVDGITDVYVASEEEMLEVLAMGERNRTVASTKMNNSSSRSHQLFMLEVKQKLPNDSEKRGILNLVDLAGSEKINQTGVTGNKLEEAKKINLSLSALGNVIKALTSSSEHIPYRDSKLTRLLQESLGGNYKTTLVVCCSPHPRNTEDTLNTLKFAQRAKTIKNKVHVNIKKSAEAYLKIIEELKLQLRKANDDAEFWKHKAGLVKEHTQRRSSTFKFESLSALRVSAEAPEENESGGLEEISDYSYESKNEPTNEEIAELKSEIEDLKAKIATASDSLLKESHKRILCEQKSFEAVESYNKLLLGINHENAKHEYLSEENSSLYQQIEFYKNHIRALNSKFNEILQKLQNGEQITEWKFVDSSESLRPMSVFTHDLTQDDLQVEELTGIAIDANLLIAQDTYAREMCLALENSSQLNQDIIIFELKKQIILSGLVNSKLHRKLADIQLREAVLKEKYNIKLKLVKFQEAKIKAFEETSKRIQRAYDKLIRRLESYLNGAVVVKGNEGIKRAKIAKPIKGSVIEGFERNFKRTSTNNPGESFLKMRRQSTMGNLNHIKLKGLESGFGLQNMLNQQLKQEILLISDERNAYKSQLAVIQQNNLEIYSKEKSRWKAFLDTFTENCNKELTRRQQEINKLNQQMAHWMSLFLEQQQSCKCKQKRRYQNKSTCNFESTSSEATFNLNLLHSPLHSELKKATLSILNSRSGDVSPMGDL